MPWVCKRTFLLTRIWDRLAASVAISLALAASFSSPARAADNPAKFLQSRFEAAKASLAAGNLASAENFYIDAINFGLRQLAQLSISEGQTDQASAYLDSALKLNSQDVETQVAAADVWFRKGEVGRAKATLQSIVAKNPRHARARGLLGRIYVFEGNSDDAIEELKASVDIESDFETSYFLGIAYLKSRKVDDALSWFKQLESTMGESAALHVLFGRAYLITKFSQQAIPEFSKAITLDAKYPRAHSFLGYAYLEHYQEEGYPRARAEFEKEVRLYPNEYRVQELLGIANVNLRDFSSAEVALLHAKRLNPREPSPYLYLGEVYAATNRIRAAVEVLEKYVTLVGNPGDEKLREASRAYYLLGQNLRRLGREQEAKKALARSQQIREAKFKHDVKHIFDEKKSRPDNDESPVSDRVVDLLAAGSDAEKRGTQDMLQQGLPAREIAQHPAASRETQAIKQYRSFVREVLGSSYNDLGVMRAKDTRFRDAAEFFQQAARWKSDLLGLDRNLGFANFRAELYSDAVPPLERQLQAHPDDAFVRQLLGLSYSMLEKDEKVVEVLRPFLGHPPNDPGLLLAWGTALVRTRQSAAAAEVFRRMLEENVNNASVHLLLGKAYAQQKNYPGALNEFNEALRLNPQLSEAHYYAGLVYLRQGEFEFAAREFRSELELRPSEPHTMYHLGYALLSQGQLPESVALFRAVVKAMPSHELAYFELGRALLQQGDVTGAIENLEAAKTIAPGHDAAYFQLSQAYRRAGRAHEAGQALAAYQKLIEASRLKKRETLEMEKP